MLSRSTAVRHAALFLLLAGSASLPAATPATSVTVPIYNLLDDDGNNRVAISVDIGGSGVSKLYELDTGSSGMMAAYNPAWAGRAKITKQTGTKNYDSGTQYNYAVVTTTVDLGSGAIAQNVPIGRITTADNPKPGGFTNAQWQAEVKAGQPPLYGNFFGTFGCDLSGAGTTGIASVLAQMPGNLSTGYIVALGSNEVGTPAQGKLTIGLTDELRAQFPIKLKLLNGGATFPNGLPTYDQYGLTATATVSDIGGTATYSWPTPLLLDTGGPGTHIHALGIPIPSQFLSPDGTQLKSGSSFTISVPSATPYSSGWQYANNVNKASGRAVEVDTQKLGINAGILPYFSYDIMFDLVNGEVGLRPRGEYHSPYVFSPWVSHPNVVADFVIRPRAPTYWKEWSHTPYAQWGDFHYINDILRSSWGPYFQDFGDPGKITTNSRDWQALRLAAAGNEIRGLYPYAHHHMHVWNVPIAQPWVTSGYWAGQGIDCSDFTNWMYNYGLGITLKTGIGEQAEMTSAPLYASFGSTVSKAIRGERLFDVHRGYAKDYATLCASLQPGDLLYIRSDPALDLPVSHVIMWLGWLASDTNQQDANLVFDSHGGMIVDSNGVIIPTGPQIRPFQQATGQQGYYYGCFDHVVRYLPLKEE